MAILSTLLSVAKPTGMWESIIWAFEGFTKNYVLAVILLTIIIRIIWSPLETYNRRISAKNATMQAKMQPELQKVQEKYGHDKQLLNQKTNEVYKKHNFNMAGSCGFMLVFMVLNLVIFFTLFSGLNKISSFKIYENYDNLKEYYSNCLSLSDNNKTEYQNAYTNDKDLEFRVFVEGEDKIIGLFEKTEETTSVSTALISDNYLTLEELKEFDVQDVVKNKDGSDATNEDGSLKLEPKYANDVINSYIENLDLIVLVEEVKDGDVVVTEKVTLLDVVTEDSMSLIEVQYQENKESFLWIENVWVADSPFKTSIFDYKGFSSMVKNNIEKGEESVYNSFMPLLSDSQGRVNGYLILPLLCIAISFLSTWLSQKTMTKKSDNNQQPVKQGKAMQIIMPLIMGIFAIFYNSVFAIYMVTSQAISTALLPLQNLIVRKLENRADKKKMQTQTDQVDYRRK